MYRYCFHCHADLGHNQVVEPLPVGRRLAFDAEKGRLWVICPACGQWNLTPFGSRWEAIEACERLYRETPTRASTGQIGLARVPEGTELVRIGEPLRPEFAAWRYGDRIRKRRRRLGLYVGAGALTVGILVTGSLAAGAASGVLLPNLVNVPVHLFRYLWNRRVVARVPTDEGDGRVDVRGEHLNQAALRRGETPDEFRVIVPHEEGEAVLRGEQALRTSGILLAHANRFGASSKAIRGAVERLEGLERPARFFGTTLSEAASEGYGYSPLVALPKEYRLPLEMAAHEEAESRALEGELAELEAAWREAEEIASIADRLVVPEAVERWIRRAREAVDRGAEPPRFLDESLR